MDLLPSKWHVSLDHFRFHGQFPNLAQPKTFSERIASRKLYDRDVRLPAMVDKILSKEQMAARFGADFIIPTIATFDSERKIDFSSLPYPCVIKANHGSNMNLYLLKYPDNEKSVRRELREFLQRDYHAIREEWAYSKVQRRLLVEPYIDGGEHGLVDYKFHTFRGRVFAIEVVTDRYTSHTGATFDPNWNELPCQLGIARTRYPILPPHDLDKMLRRAEQIGKDFSYVRVDLYEINGQAKFGEMTFYPGGGLDVFEPREYDSLFGEQWV
jgi:hypothetical protein